MPRGPGMDSLMLNVLVVCRGTLVNVEEKVQIYRQSLGPEDIDRLASQQLLHGQIPLLRKHSLHHHGQSMRSVSEAFRHSGIGHFTFVA